MPKGLPWKENALYSGLKQKDRKIYSRTAIAEGPCLGVG